MASGDPIKTLIRDAKYMHNNYCFERDDREPRSGERPRTVLGFSSFGGSEMPSNTWRANRRRRKLGDHEDRPSLFLDIQKFGQNAGDTTGCVLPDQLRESLF